MNHGAKPTVFIGSSNEKSEVAEELGAILSEYCEVTIWRDAFKVGATVFERLMYMKDNFDFAIIVLTGDDLVEIRDAKVLVPRDNVVFELGLFLGSIGPGRVFAVLDENVKTKLPSDYFGVVYVTYDANRTDRNLASALRPACVRIKSAIRQEGPRSTSPRTVTQHAIPEIGIDHVYRSYLEAESDILREFEETQGPVRLFLYVASQNVGSKGRCSMS